MNRCVKVDFVKPKWYSTNLAKEYLKLKDSSLLTCHLNGLERPDGEEIHGYVWGCQKT